MSLLSLRIALRFLTSSKAQTVLIVIGIAIGVSVQVFVGSLIGSLQQTLIDNTVGNSSQVTVVSATDDITISDWESIVGEVEQNPSIKATCPVADSPAFAKSELLRAPVIVRGFDMAAGDAIYDLQDSMYEGNLPAASGEVMVGKELTSKLGVGIGGSLELFTSEGFTYNVSITGLYDLGVVSINEAWVITTLGTAQAVFNFGNQVTSIENTVFDVFTAKTVAAEINTTLSNSSLKVENWEDQNQQLLSGLSAQSTSSLMIQVFVLAAVVIAIASILAIKVVQKSRQLGILKAMGIKDRSASLIFLFEGAILGIGGSIIGVSLGLLLLYSFGTFATNPDGTPLITLYLDYPFIVGSGVIAVFAATLAAVLPARKSSKLSPIEVIRSG